MTSGDDEEAQPGFDGAEPPARTGCRAAVLGEDMSGFISAAGETLTDLDGSISCGVEPPGSGSPDE